MFNYKHYVPILKWRPAEQQALSNLSPARKELLSPLIQLVMPPAKNPRKGEREKTPEEKRHESIALLRESLSVIPNRISECWGNTPIYIDTSLLWLPKLRVEALDQITSIGEKIKLFLVPVINLSSNIEIKEKTYSINKKFSKGLCVRLVPADFSDFEKLKKELSVLLKASDTSEDAVDLLIDLQEDKDDEYFSILKLSQEIPSLTNYRTFIVASGMFPVDLSKCKVDKENIIPRDDWSKWSQTVTTKKLKRMPAYSDYTIRHPVYRESTLFFSPSASICYTLKDCWLVIRGQKGKSEQYLANANILSSMPEFFGADYSEGDKYIVEKGKYLKEYLKNPKKGGTGNAKSWIEAGINHHLACTSDQVANLP